MKEKPKSDGCYYAAIDLARRFPNLAAKFLELVINIADRIYPPKK